MVSIRKQLLRRILSGTSAILLAGSIVLALAIHNRILDGLDRNLLTQARALAVLTSVEGRALEFEPAEPQMPDFRQEQAQAFYQAQFLDGQVFSRSSSLREHRLPVTPPSAAGAPMFRNVRLPDGRRGRLVSYTFSPRIEPEEADLALDEDPEAGWKFELPAGMMPRDVRVVMTVARVREQTDLLLASLLLALAVVDGLILIGIGLLVRRSLDAGLRPLATLNDRIRRLSGDTLHQRVTLDAPPEELQPVVTTLNELLSRLEQAFARERQFASDASHELRTPVAELRTACEVGARWPDDRESAARFFRDAGEIARQMERIVTQLMQLHRCDHPAAGASREPVSLAAITQTAWGKLAARARERHLSLTCRVDAAMVVMTDPEKIGLVIQNLLENAVSYAVAGSAIVCSAEESAGGHDWVLENKTSDLRPDDLTHVFERFWRKSASRHEAGHAGLGLSIVQALCDALGITVQASLPQADRFRMRLHFPSPASA
ncbi:MAG: histidine kinase dimerization/phospho-acceptor domain-containing protein [Kiritimatiellae bacterium]|nr:histidine kinase dimerization/phospho-acceptor domain-containing protein [Kiritimatiellia bacterium]